MFPTFATQRGVLEHPSTKVYFTHGGGSSANEGLFHGNPMIEMGYSSIRFRIPPNLPLPAPRFYSINSPSLL